MGERLYGSKNFTRGLIVNTTVKIGRLRMKNPVMAASGTFGPEYNELVDIKRLGAIVAKTITLKPRRGNPPPRLVETPAGMLNSIGLENPGLEKFIRDKLPELLKLKTPVIASISGDCAAEFREMARRLDKTDISGVELNLSCPNIKGHQVTRSPCHRSDMLISQDAKATYDTVKAARKETQKTLIAKLTPNVTDITEIAAAAQKAGADAAALVNTFPAMAVDIRARRPLLGNITGGLSGPAIKPMALKMVWDVFSKVGIPIIGIGGIMNYKDALEFIICGASAVQVGTANFVNPKATIEIADDIKRYLLNNKIGDLKDLLGSLK
jgi:dihydroorotate dehydrogenase (NAD+) catalytic subunit